MAKRKHSGNSDFKVKISRMIQENSTEIEFRPLKKWEKEWANVGFKTIWIREEGHLSFEEQKGFIICENDRCKHRKISERVSESYFKYSELVIRRFFRPENSVLTIEPI